MAPQEWMTPAEVAELIRIPEGTLAQWRYKRRGPKYHRMGKHVRYERAAVLAWAREQQSSPAA